MRPLGDATTAQLGLACGTSAWLSVLDAVARTTSHRCSNLNADNVNRFVTRRCRATFWEQWRDGSASVTRLACGVCAHN
jgi:hypothetical protein